MDEEEKPVQEKEGVSKTFIAVILLVVLVSAAVVYVQLQPPSYKYETEVNGVAVHSQIPLEDLEYMKSLALYNTTGHAAVTCNFELAAISKMNNEGYKVLIEEGEQGIFLQRDRAYIKGESEEEILKACNMFSCMREGIDCEGNIWALRGWILQARRISIVVDNELSDDALRGYGDILAAMGYIQAEHYLEDVDGDGKISKTEIEENLIKIFPYIKEEDECKLQAITTIHQKLNATNETFDCDTLGPAILLLHGEENRIYLEGDRVIIEGDNEAVGSGAIIMRDVVSPEFIRSLYLMD